MDTSGVRGIILSDSATRADSAGGVDIRRKRRCRNETDLGESDMMAVCADCDELFDGSDSGITRQSDNAQICEHCAMAYDFCCSGCCELVTLNTADDGLCERCRTS